MQTLKREWKSRFPLGSRKGYQKPQRDAPPGFLLASWPSDQDAFTACVLACRKLLIHLAVQEGAKPNLSFVDYIDYLANKGYVPPNGKIWVDHIRKKGNEANHEIVLMSQDDARELLSFVEMLLKFMYEFPARINAKAGGT